MCYSAKDKNLTTFTNHYSQDNCVLECKTRKIMKICKCYPWYMGHQKGLKICDNFGNKCIKDEFEAYGDDLLDREDCDCRYNYSN